MEKDKHSKALCQRETKPNDCCIVFDSLQRIAIIILNILLLLVQISVFKYFANGMNEMGTSPDIRDCIMKFLEM